MRWITLLPMVWLGSLTGYSQTLVLSKTKDTLVCFTQPRGIYLLKRNEKVKELDSLLTIKKAQNVNLNKQVANDSSSVVDLTKVHKNDQEAISLQATAILKQDKELKSAGNKIKWQKVQKWIAVALIPVAGYGGFRLGLLLKE